MSTERYDRTLLHLLLRSCNSVVSRRPFTMETRVQFQPNSRGSCSESGSRKGYAVTVIPPMPHTHLHVVIFIIGHTKWLSMDTFNQNSAFLLPRYCDGRSRPTVFSFTILVSISYRHANLRKLKWTCLSQKRHNSHIIVLCCVFLQPTDHAFTRK